MATDKNERGWERADRLPHSLLQEFHPVAECEIVQEYYYIYDDLAERYHPSGPAETHCVEMMATALWCERRAVGAETAAYSLDFDDMALPKEGHIQERPEGYTAAEQIAIAMDRLNRTRFLDFLQRYKEKQIRLFNLNLARLKQLRADNELVPTVTPIRRRPEPSEQLERRMREFQNEPKAA